MPKGKVEIASTLKRSFRCLIEDPGFIGLYLLPAAVSAVASLLIFNTLISRLHAIPTTGIRSWIASNIWWIVGWGVAYGIALVVISLAAHAGVILKATARERGKGMSFSAALRGGFGFVPKLFVASVLMGLIIGTPFLAFILLAILVSPIVIIGVLIWLLPMIYIGVRLYLYAQACVIEDLGPVECLKRSWRTTKGNFWRIFATGLILAIIGGIISAAVNLIPIIGSILGSLITTLFIAPATAIAFTLIYLSLARG